MANVIDDATIEYVGILAKLELSDEEKEQAKKDMASMLDYIDKLGELDTTGIEPMSHVFPVENVMREDVVTNGDGSEETLANAPERHDTSFVVPKTVDCLDDDYGFIKYECCQSCQGNQGGGDYSGRGDGGSYCPD